MGSIYSIYQIYIINKTEEELNYDCYDIFNTSLIHNPNKFSNTEDILTDWGFKILN